MKYFLMQRTSAHVSLTPAGNSVSLFRKYPTWATVCDRTTNSQGVGSNQECGKIAAFLPLFKLYMTLKTFLSQEQQYDNAKVKK